MYPFSSVTSLMVKDMISRPMVDSSVAAASCTELANFSRLLYSSSTESVDTTSRSLPSRICRAISSMLSLTSLMSLPLKRSIAFKMLVVSFLTFSTTVLTTLIGTFWEDILSSVVISRLEALSDM